MIDNNRQGEIEETLQPQDHHFLFIGVTMHLLLITKSYINLVLKKLFHHLFFGFINVLGSPSNLKYNVEVALKSPYFSIIALFFEIYENSKAWQIDVS